MNDSVPPAPVMKLPPGNVAAYIDSQRQAPWKSSPHAHEGYEFLYVIRGTKKFLMNGKLYYARTGDLIIFRPGEVHEEFSVSKTISRMVIRCHPTDMAVAATAFPPSEKIGPVTRLPWKERFGGLFARMADEKQHPKACSDLLLGAYLVEFVVLLVRAAEEIAPEEKDESGTAHHRVRTAVEMIRQNIGVNLSLSELARTSFMSVSHFSHVFKETVGEPPKEFLIEQRIEKAKQLLLKTGSPACEVAAKLGYDNPYYFYRLFKKKTGMTPGQYVRSARKCIPNSGKSHFA
jgi:AraC-like DNA-binding protein